MFALLANGGLYLKVDDQSRPIFAQRNLKAFSFTAKGRTVRLSYHEAPPQAMEDEAEMAHWCQFAWEAALRAKDKAARKGEKGVRGKKKDVEKRFEPADRLIDLPNLGPRSVESLLAAGISTLEDLRELGAVRAFVRARTHSPAVSLTLLWALEGALTGRRWQDVAETDRASLLMALEDVQREA